jgi:hypothetical protein
MGHVKRLSAYKFDSKLPQETDEDVSEPAHDAPQRCDPAKLERIRQRLLHTRQPQMRLVRHQAISETKDSQAAP